MKLLLILIILSTSAFAVSKKKCIENLPQVKRIEGFELPEKLCDNKDFRKITTKELSSYNQCIENVSKIAKLYRLPYSSCIDEYFRDQMDDGEFVLCAEILINYEVRSGVKSYCRRSSSRELVLSDEFNVCMNKTIPLNGGESYQICSSNAKRSVVLSYNYDKCVKRRKPLDGQEKVRKCSSMKVMTAAMKKAISECKADIAGLNISDFACNSDSFRRIENKKTCLATTVQSIDMSEMSLMEIKQVANYADKDCNSKTKLKELDNVKYLNSQYFLTSQLLDKHKIGGLSAVAYNDKDKAVYFVSDDQGFHGPSRVIKGSITTKASAMRVVLEENILLKKHKKLDAEGLQIDRDGNLIISSETLNKDSKTLLRRFNTDGELVDELTTPDDYIKKFEMEERKYTYNERIRTNSLNPFAKPTYRYRRKTEKRKVEVQKQGIQDNKGFEALALSKNKDVLYVANEQVLVQDKELLRISKLKEKGNDYELLSSYLYKIDKTHENGLVEILELEDNILLTLERRYDYQKGKVIANIFKVDLSTNIEGKALKKELFLNLDDLIEYLPPGLRKIDNIEGMGIGPTLESGNRSLILVSDNNFNYKQKTQIIFLELKSGSL